MDKVIIVVALLLSALAMIGFAAYYRMQAQREQDVRGIANPHIWYLSISMIAVAVLEVAAAIYIIFFARKGGVKDAGTAGASGAQASKDLKINKARMSRDDDF